MPRFPVAPDLERKVENIPREFKATEIELRCSERVSKRGPGKHLSHLQSRSADLALWLVSEREIDSITHLQSPFPCSFLLHVFSSSHFTLTFLISLSFLNAHLPLGFTSHSFPTLQSSVLCSFLERFC